jgi:hypothetical protein
MQIRQVIRAGFALPFYPIQWQITAIMNDSSKQPELYQSSK